MSHILSRTLLQSKLILLSFFIRGGMKNIFHKMIAVTTIDNFKHTTKAGIKWQFAAL